MRNFIVRARANLLLSAGAIGPVMAQPIDAVKSKIAVTFTQMGVPVEAHFTRFHGDVSFDGKAPQQTQANLIVDVASFDLGDPEYNKEVQKPDWFNAAKFAQAIFVSKSVRVLATDRLEATGTLTIKGRTQNVVVPMTVRQAGSSRTFVGELPIKRLAFNLGEGEWKETDMVADDVKISFTVVTVAQ